MTFDPKIINRMLLATLIAGLTLCGAGAIGSFVLGISDVVVIVTLYWASIGAGGIICGFTVFALKRIEDQKRAEEQERDEASDDAPRTRRPARRTPRVATGAR